MKQFVVTFVATVGLVIPALPAGAGPSNPAAYQPLCDQGYQAMRPVYDAVLSPGKALFGPVETTVCGEQKYTPAAA
jgi:hypothetical protein